jgi:mRNA-degrading endonuclease RelE of RelBE toxin-antitoxin system
MDGPEDRRARDKPIRSVVTNLFNSNLFATKSGGRQAIRVERSPQQTTEYGPDPVLLYTIKDDILLVLVLRIGHRREIYRLALPKLELTADEDENLGTSYPPVVPRASRTNEPPPPRVGRA